MIRDQEKVRLCKDCRWWSEQPLGNNDENFDLCRAPEFNPPPPQDLVRGDSVRKRENRNYCEILRGSPLKCGPEGKFWEERGND